MSSLFHGEARWTVFFNGKLIGKKNFHPVVNSSFELKGVKYLAYSVNQRTREVVAVKDPNANRK